MTNVINQVESSPTLTPLNRLDSPLYSDIVKSSPDNRPSVPSSKVFKKPIVITRSDNNKGKYTDSNSESVTIVNSKARKLNFATGKRKTNEKLLFKGAERCIDIYIGRCSENVTPEMLEDYMKTDLNIQLRKCQQLSTKVPYSSAFKVTVNDNYKNIMLDPESWPEGVICRRFYTNRY